MNNSLNSTIATQYVSCGHRDLNDSAEARKVLDGLASGNEGTLTPALHAGGHWGAHVADEVPALLRELEQVLKGVGAGDFPATTVGEGSLFDMRVAAEAGRKGDKVAPVEQVYAILQTGVQIDELRAATVACVGDALQKIDRTIIAQGRRSGMDETHHFIAQVNEAFSTDLSFGGPSDLRRWFVAGTSHSLFMPQHLPLYGYMLRHGSFEEVSMAVAAIEGFVGELTDPAYRETDYWKKLVPWSGYFRECLEGVRQGMNPSCAWSRLCVPLASSPTTPHELTLLQPTVANRIESLIKHL